MPKSAADHADDGSEDGAAADGEGELDEAQLALLAAGVRLLARLDRDDLTRLVSAIAVADEAEMNRQTIYRRWKGHPAYFDELIRYVTEPARSVGVERLEELQDEAEEVDPDDPAAVVRTLSGRTFGAFTGDPTQMVRMLLWSVHLNDDGVAHAMRTLYRTLDERAAAGFGMVGKALGIEPRPPFTLETVALLFNALRDGLTLHLALDPDRVPATFHGDVMVGLTQAVVRRIDDPDDEIDVDEAFRRAVRRSQAGSAEAG